MKIALLLMCFCAVASAQDYMGCGAACSDSQQTCTAPAVNYLPNCEITACTVNPTTDECEACYADTLQADEGYQNCLTGNASCIESQQIYQACTDYNNGLTGCVADMFFLDSIGESGEAAALWTICTTQLQNDYDTQADAAITSYGELASAYISQVNGLIQGAASAATACEKLSSN